MALNPIVFTEKLVRSFLRYQLTAYPSADPRLDAQMRQLLSLDQTRHSPLLKGPYGKVPGTALSICCSLLEEMSSTRGPPPQLAR